MSHKPVYRLVYFSQFKTYEFKNFFYSNANFIMYTKIEKYILYILAQGKQS